MNKKVLIYHTDTVWSRFLKKVESLSGSVDLHQRTVLYNTIEKLKGVGTPNGTDLLTQMIQVGSLFFPLMPINDTTASKDAFEIDLISGKKKGEYVGSTMDISVMGALSVSNSDKFLLHKTMGDYAPQSGSIFTYCKDEIPQNSLNVPFGNVDGSTLSIPRRDSNNWSYVGWNGSADSSLVSGRIWKGMIGIHQRNDPRYLFAVEQKNKFCLVYGNYVGVPSTTPNSSPFYFHGRNTSQNGFDVRLSMYAFGLPFSTAAQVIDFSDAIDYYQRNIVSTQNRAYN